MAKYERTHELVDASFDVIPGNSAASVDVFINGTTYSQVQVSLSQNNVTQTATRSISSNNVQSISIVFDTLTNYVDLEVSVQVLNRATGSWKVLTSNTMFSVYPSPWVTPLVTNKLYYIPPGTKGTNPSNSQVRKKTKIKKKLTFLTKI